MTARHKNRARVRAQSLDRGDPIELTYNETIDSYEASEISYETDSIEEREAKAFDWDDDAEAFEVEAFEVDNEEDWDAADIGTGRESQAFSASDRDDDASAEELDFSNLDAAQSRDQVSRGLSDSEFSADLQAILNGEKTYDRDRMANITDDEDELATTKSQNTSEDISPDHEAGSNPHDVFSQMSQHMPHNQMGDAPLAQVNSQAAEAADDDERPHDVFDRMGRNMSYANAFDLGSISLEQRFEEFDDAIDKEEEKIRSKNTVIQKKHEVNNTQISAPLALDDAALVADLDLMHKAMAVECNVSEEDKESHEDKESQSTPDKAVQAIQPGASL